MAVAAKSPVDVNAKAVVDELVRRGRAAQASFADADQARSRKDHAPANLAVLRRLALNIARAHPDTKTSLRGKLKRAAWDDSFLVDMLLNMR